MRSTAYTCSVRASGQRETSDSTVNASTTANRFSCSRRLEWRMGWQREAHLARLSFQCLGIRDATRYRVVSSGEKLRGSVGWAGEAAKKTKPKRPPGELKGGERRGRSSRGKQAASCRYRYLCCPRWANSSRSHSTAMTHEYAQLLALARVDRFRGARAKPASASLRSRALRGVQPGPLWHGDGWWHAQMAAGKPTARPRLLVLRARAVRRS